MKVDFRCAEYREDKVVADQELIRQILDVGIRRTARSTGIDSKTVMLITRRQAVKPTTLATIMKFFT
jgi:hypothetical protein